MPFLKLKTHQLFSARLALPRGGRCVGRDMCSNLPLWLGLLRMSIWGCNFKRGNCDCAACNLINIYKWFGGGPENTMGTAFFHSLYYFISIHGRPLRPHCN